MTRSNITVNVTNSKPSQGSRPAEAFNDFKANHPGRMYGIDVSKWQGNIDFGRVRNAGADFVLMRIGFGNCEVAQRVVTGAKVIKSINTKILYPLVELLRVLATC